MVLIKNKKIHLNYEVEKTYNAGLELLGYEVKSLRDGQGSLKGSYIKIKGGEAFLVGATIPPYQPQNTPEDYNPERERKLLLKKKEVAELAEQEKQKGLTIVPISVYNKGGKLKLEIAVARGKKKFDKREAIKKKDAKRDVEREAKYKLR